MARSSKRWVFLGLMMVIAAGLASDAATAQSEHELRREIERLRTENRDLQRELDAAKARISELEGLVERLRRQLDTVQPPDRPTERPRREVTIDESVPSASPRALFAALRASYTEATEDLDIGQPDDRTRAQYLRRLERWAAQVNREHRAPVKWHVTIRTSEETQSGLTLTLLAVDAKTRAELGAPLRVDLGRGLARRFENYAGRARTEVFVLRGTLVPEVSINPERRTAGVFDNPQLIGPFAEFEFRIDATSLMPMAEDRAAHGDESAAPGSAIESEPSR